MTTNPLPSIHSVGPGQSDFNETKLEPGLEDIQNPPEFPFPPSQLFSKPYSGFGRPRHSQMTESEPIRKFTFDSSLESLISQLSSKRYLNRQKALDFLEKIIQNHFNQILIHPHDPNPENSSETPILVAQTTNEAASSQFQKAPIHFTATTGIPLPRDLRQQLFNSVKQNLGDRTTLDPIGGDLQRLSGIPTGMIHPTIAPSLIVSKLKPLPLSEKRRQWLWDLTKNIIGMFSKTPEPQTDSPKEPSWEVLQSAFLSMALALKIQFPLPNFFKFSLFQCKKHLIHPEARVRFAVGQTLHVLAFMELFHLSPHTSVPATMLQVDHENEFAKLTSDLGKPAEDRLRLSGPLFFVYDYIIGSVISNIDTNFARHSKLAEADAQKPKIPDRKVLSQSQVIQEIVRDVSLDSPLVTPLGASLKSAHDKHVITKKAELRHDTEGWRSLESSFKVIQQLMSAYGVAFSPLLLNHLSESNSPHSIFPRLVKAVSHINRYVREVGFLLLGTLCQVASLDPGVYGSWDNLTSESGAGLSKDPRPAMFSDFDLNLWDKQNHGIPMPHHSVFGILIPSIVPVLASGLADNWSQVRFAASIATRHLFDSLFTYLARFYTNFTTHFKQSAQRTIIGGPLELETVADSRFSHDPDHQSKVNQTYTEINEEKVVSAESKVANTQLRIPFPFEIAQPFDLDFIYSSLLPALCLNRYYLAAGVRNFNQETWRRVTQSYGKELIGFYIGPVVEFYVSQSKADNHAVRQAACSVLSELGSKLASKITQAEHVTRILDALVDCFKDSSWPVREAACTALSSFVTFYPDQSFTLVEKTILPLWLDHLSDNIWSVRESAALALGRVLRTFTGLRVQVIKYLKDNIEAVYSQPVDSTLFANLENSTLFGVAAAKVHATHAHHNDQDIHSNQPLFSCGSLAPKIKRGGGCMDHGFTRPKQKWEITDGCIYLLRELAISLYSDPASLPELFDPVFVKLVEISVFEKKNATTTTTTSQVETTKNENEKIHFYHDHVLLLTIYKQIPVILARFLGINEDILDHRSHMDSQPSLSGLPQNPGDILPTYNVHDWGFGVPVKPNSVSQPVPYHSSPEDSKYYDPITILLPSLFKGIISNIHSIMSRKLVACAVVELLLNLSDIFGPDLIVKLLTTSITKKYPMPNSGKSEPPPTEPLFSNTVSGSGSGSGSGDILLSYTSILNFFARSPYLFRQHKFAGLLSRIAPKVNNSEWRKFERRLDNLIYSRGISKNSESARLPDLNIDPAVFNRIV